MSNRELPTQEVKRVETRVLVATTAMLAFISFWRAAAIVLNDMGSSAFYAGAIAEHFIGKTGPWFILAIMCLAYAVRSIYIESCSMFVRGGVYRVVKEAMGSTLAKFSVSALMFDYILTGPISGVSAAYIWLAFLNELLRYAHVNFVLPVNLTAARFLVQIGAFSLSQWRSVVNCCRSELTFLGGNVILKVGFVPRRTSQSVDAHVSNLRKKLGATRHGAERIKAIRSVGYVYAIPGKGGVKFAVQSLMMKVFL